MSVHGGIGCFCCTSANRNPIPASPTPVYPTPAKRTSTNSALLVAGVGLGFAAGVALAPVMAPAAAAVWASSTAASAGKSLLSPRPVASNDLAFRNY